MLPYPCPVNAKVLRQNTGKQAAIVNAVEAARAAFGNSLPMMMEDHAAWTALVRRVAGVVRFMPSWKVQTVGQERWFTLERRAQNDETTGVALPLNRGLAPVPLRKSSLKGARHFCFG